MKQGLFFICNAVTLANIILDTKLGIIQQDAKDVILVSGEIRGTIQSIMKLPHFNVKGSCDWKDQDNERIREALKQSGNSVQDYDNHTLKERVNDLIQQEANRRNQVLVSELQRRFGTRIPTVMRNHVDATPTVISNPSACRAEGIECEFQPLPIPEKCGLGEQECGLERICCPIKLYASESGCPKKAHEILAKYNQERTSKLDDEDFYCVRITKARKANSRNKRSFFRYWGDLGILSGSYTDEKVLEEQKVREAEAEAFSNQIESIGSDVKKVYLETKHIENGLDKVLCDLSSQFGEITEENHAKEIFDHVESLFQNALERCESSFIPETIQMDKLIEICESHFGKITECQKPINLFRCSRQSIYLTGDEIHHVMRYILVRPVSNVQSFEMATIPVPSINKTSWYHEIDFPKKMYIFTLSATINIIFNSCEWRNDRRLCEIGKGEEHRQRECVINIMRNSTEGINSHCSRVDFYGSPCMVTRTFGQTVVSSRDYVNIDAIRQAGMHVMSAEPIYKCKGVCPIKAKEDFSFTCGKIKYSIEIEDEVMTNITVKESFTHISGLKPVSMAMESDYLNNYMEEFHSKHLEKLRKNTHLTFHASIFVAALLIVCVGVGVFVANKIYKRISSLKTIANIVSSNV